MNWNGTWKWMAGLAAAVVAARTNILQGVLSILLVLALASAIVFPFALFSMDFVATIAGGLEFLERRIRHAVDRTHAMLAHLLHSLSPCADPRQGFSSAAAAGEAHREGDSEVAAAAVGTSCEIRSERQERSGRTHCFKRVPISVIPANLDSGGLASEGSVQFSARPFEPHPLFRNPHVATVAAAYWPRDFSGLPPATNRLFEVEAGTRLLAKCHWQESRRLHGTLVLVHGLEGSSESPDMLGIAERAFQRGFNVLRMNQRNCGGTEHLTPTLCHSGLSEDYRAVLSELIECDRMPEIFFSGFSTGGNLVLKMAGELAERTPRELRGICAVSPCLDLAACADGSGHPRNFVYESYFLRSMRNTLRRKAALFPERYQSERFFAPRSVREWDEAITSPEWGYRDAADYYDRGSALHVIGQIRVPTLVIAAQDDPLVPITSFRSSGIAENRFITFITHEHGGHCAFISSKGGSERFWAEQCVLEFCTSQSVS